MRVVHISKVIGIAGSEGHLLSLLPGLAQHNVEPYMILLADPRIPVESFCESLAACGVDYEIQPLKGHIDFSLTRRLAERLAALKPDLVHTHLIHADLYGLPAARRAGVTRRVSSRHNDDKFRRLFLMKWLNRRAAANTARIIAISDALARFVINVEGIDASKVVTVRYGLDAAGSKNTPAVDLRKEVGLPLDVPVIGFFGRLIEQKGVDVLIHAFKDLHTHHHEAHLLIVGDGLLRDELEFLASQLALLDKVHFTGWVENGQRLMPACDIVVVPSRWEGFGLVTLEAMRHARAIVASRVSALPEIVVDGETGRLVPVDDSIALSKALSELLTNPELTEQMGQAGYERLVESFSVDKMVQETLAVYRDVVEV